MPLMTVREFEDRCRLIEGARQADFLTVMKIAKLDPLEHLQFADWADVSFENCDLRNFDFRGARLHDCKFGGATICGANFSQSELGTILLHEGRETPRAPARVSGIADLRAAADWGLYSEDLRERVVNGMHRGRVPIDCSHLPIGAIFSDAPGVAPEMIVVPPGEYWMGSPDGTDGEPAEEGRSVNEGPRQLIRFDRPFAIGRFTVAVDEHRQFRNSKRRSGAPDFGRRPATEVSWRDAVAYCAWLNRQLGLPSRTYRLPSEAEWEYAARAGTTGPFWWDGGASKSRANFDGEGTVQVDRYEPNPWGLYQMQGNVWEWCDDAYAPTLEGVPCDGTSRQGKADDLRAVRGGSWNYTAYGARSADRGRNQPYDRISYIGFRLARTL